MEEDHVPGLCKSEKALESLSGCHGRRHGGPDNGLSWVLKGEEFVQLVARELERTLEEGRAVCFCFCCFLSTVFLLSRTVQVAG